MNSRHHLALIALILGATACTESPPLAGSQPPPPVVRLATPAVWPGGPIVMHLTRFPESPVEAGVRLWSVTYPMHQVDDTTWVAVVPPTIRPGWVDATVMAADTAWDAGIVRIAGAADRRVHPTGAPFSQLVPYSIGENAKLMVPTDSDLVFLDLETGSAITDPRLRSTAAGGPAPTNDPLVWILQPDRGGPLERWRIWPVLDRLDTLPRFGIDRFSAYALFDFEVIAGIPDDRGWVRELRHDGSHRDLFGLVADGPVKIRISPDGSLATMVGSRVTVEGSSGTGAPLFHLDLRDVTHPLPDMPWLADAAFATYGDFLAVTGPDAAGHATRLRVIGRYGPAAALDTTYAAPIRGIAFDPDWTMLYVATGSDSTTLDLVVYQWTGSYTRIGDMRMACEPTCGDRMLVVPSITGNVFVVEPDASGGLVAYRFIKGSPYEFWAARLVPPEG